VEFILKRKLGHFLYLISITTVVVVGLLFVIVGVKNLNDAPDIADRIAPSKAYENYGFSTIEAWQASFENKSKNKIFVGIGLIAAMAGVVVIKKSCGKK